MVRRESSVAVGSAEGQVEEELKKTPDRTTSSHILDFPTCGETTSFSLFFLLVVSQDIWVNQGKKWHNLCANFTTVWNVSLVVTTATICNTLLDFDSWIQGGKTEYSIYQTVSGNITISFSAGFGNTGRIYSSISQFKWRLSHLSCWLRHVKATSVANRQNWSASIMLLSLWKPAGWLTWFTRWFLLPS